MSALLVPVPSAVSARAELAAALADLLDGYSMHDRPLSAWDSHCLGLVLTLLRFGYHEQARRKVREILQPPLPLPPFRPPRPLTLDDVRLALRLLASPPERV